MQNNRETSLFGHIAVAAFFFLAIYLGWVFNSCWILAGLIVLLIVLYFYGYGWSAILGFVVGIVFYVIALYMHFMDALGSIFNPLKNFHFPFFVIKLFGG